MGLIRIQQKKHEEAVSYLQTVLRVDPAGPVQPAAGQLLRVKGGPPALDSALRSGLSDESEAARRQSSAGEPLWSGGACARGHRARKGRADTRAQVAAGPYHPRHTLCQERRSPRRHRHVQRRHPPRPELAGSLLRTRQCLAAEGRDCQRWQCVQAYHRFESQRPARLQGNRSATLLIA
jgi:hypothetical protein